MRKLTLKPPRPFKNLNAPYRMVFINDETLEEVASFHLTKKSLYTLFSTIFLITILTTVFILIFTPLKYYIPGYGSNTIRMQTIQLERKVDSLTRVATSGQQQADRIRALIAGKDIAERDTTMLKPELIKSPPEGILPDPKDVRQQAVQQVKIESGNGRRKKK